MKYSTKNWLKRRLVICVLFVAFLALMLAVTIPRAAAKNANTVTLTLDPETVFYLIDLPEAHAKGLEWFRWTAQLDQSYVGQRVNLHFSHDGEEWRNLWYVTVDSKGIASGHQPVDSSWAVSGKNYLRAVVGNETSNIVVLTVNVGWQLEGNYIIGILAVGFTGAIASLWYIKRRKKHLFLRYVAIILVISSIALSLRLLYIDNVWYGDEHAWRTLGEYLLRGRLAGVTNTGRYPLYLAQGCVIGHHHVEPWLDHPPLFGALLSSALALHVNPRIVPILLSTATACLIYFLLREDRTLAIISSFLFAVYPYATIMNAILYGENAASFFFMVTLLSSTYYLKRKDQKLLYLSGIFAGLSALSSFNGLSAILYLVLFLVWKKKLLTRHSIGCIAVSLCVASIFPIIGFAANAELFLKILTSQATKSVLAPTMNNLIMTAISDFSFTKGYFIATGYTLTLFLSWLCVGYHFKKITPASLGAFSFLLTLLAIRYCWFFHWIPMYPFFAIAIGTVLTDVIKVVKPIAMPFLTHAIRVVRAV